MTVLRNRKPGSVTALAQMFEEMFRDEKANITLGSIHKAKGMEWKRVHFLNYDKCPMVWKDQTEEEHQQEINITYVGGSRAMEQLFLHPTGTSS
jgi:superfamily I DNA/RNA helicase